MLPSDPAPFADAGGLLGRALDAYLPPERVSVAEHAAQHRWLDNRGGGFVGRWSHDEAPYLREPMQALTSRDHTSVVIAGPGRSGKTAIAENWLLQSVDSDPADMLWYEPTDDALESYVKRVINPMVELHPELRSRLGVMPIDRSIHFKRFGAMWVEFLAATYSNLVGKSAGRIVVDEYDACHERDGDAYRLADVRRQSFGPESKILVVSHPDRAEGTDPKNWTRGIMRLYADSDRRCWYWPCPHCGGHSSPNPTAARVMTLHYPADAPLDEVAEAARLACPLCGGLIEDQWRRRMNLAGQWVGLGQEIDEAGELTGRLSPRGAAGFWIVGVMSPFILGGIGALARDLVSAERESEASGETKPVRDVMAKRWGIPAKPARSIGNVDAAALAERTEEFPLGTVPAGVRFLTAAIDVQAARFEVLVRGWGPGSESWLVDHRRVVADTSVSPAAWDTLLRGLLATLWPLGDGSGRGMALRAIGYDSGGAEGVTQQAYDAWLRLKRAGLSRFLGKIDGREVHSVLPMKGAGSANAPRLQVVHPMSKRTDRQAIAARDLPLLIFGANAYKDDLAGQLAVVQPGPWMVHIPARMRGNYPAEPINPRPPHVLLEQLVAEARRPNGAWEKTRPGVRNELLDLMTMSQALAELHGLRSIRWDAPPAWAAPWERSSAIGPLRAAQNEPRGTASQGPSPQPLAATAQGPVFRSPGGKPAFGPAQFNPAPQRAGRRLA